MTGSERQLLWYLRIQAFQESSKTSITTWCAKQDVPVQSMYHWLTLTNTIASSKEASGVYSRIRQSLIIYCIVETA